MTAFVVAYDLNKEAKRPQIAALLKKTFPDWVMFSESSYGIETTLTAQEVFNVFAPILDSDDRLYALHLRNPWWGQGPKGVTDWLNRCLTW